MERSELKKIAAFCRERRIAWHRYGENIIIEYEAGVNWINSYIITGFDHLVSTLQYIGDNHEHNL